MSAPSARDRAAAALQWLGLPGVILFAAVVCDLVIILPASFDVIGPRGSDLLLVPGILAMSGCALWARRQPVTATWTAAVVLVSSTALISVGDANVYTALLSNITFGETVAGFELVYFCVRTVRGGMAFVSVSALVGAALLAAFGREAGGMSGTQLVQTLVGGLLLLVFAVALGWQVRKPAARGEPNPLVLLLRAQWPLVGGFAMVLFLEMFQAARSGPVGLPVLVCSLAAAAAAVVSVRYPGRSAVALAALIVLSAVIMRAGDIDESYQVFGGIPTTQILAGMTLVVSLVRYVPTRRASGYIGLLSVAVAFGSIVNAPSTSTDSIRVMFIAALLLLGIAVSIGLYLKARDSERVKTVEAAVTEAQTTERMALARELHDVVAHHVTGIVVQAQAARMVSEQDPRIVADALGRIEDAGTEALVAMRRLVRSMRGDAPSGGSEFSEQATTDLDADLRRLAEVGTHGVATELDLDLPRDLPQEVARSALRIVQESLTNVGKHATGATLAYVSARTTGDGELHLRVSDNGTGQPARPTGGSGGYGLVGMRERVELLHGRLSAGQGPDGGWLVEVWLPLEGETTE